MRVLLDVNVILDAMLQRPPWCKEADAILQALAQGQVDCTATTLALATSFYIGRKAIGTAPARNAVRRYLAAFEILPVEKQTLLDADAMPGTDFEDNILIAAAGAAALDAIVTRNPADFSHSPIPVWEPAELFKATFGRKYTDDKPAVNESVDRSEGVCKTAKLASATQVIFAGNSLRSYTSFNCQANSPHRNQKCPSTFTPSAAGRQMAMAR
jgi:predicted nucleic acid-binding protein